MSGLQYFSYKGYGEKLLQEMHYSQAVRVGDNIEISGQDNMKKWAPSRAPILTGIGASKLGQPGMRLEVEVSAYDPKGRR
ncbi:uncharacterized protein BDZ83DRAFT_635321 [Colletotrichum acutatum]|uniref:Uncharacterized protein n=1 Tax=Glomerella acutata TaxID=27357 RepID=A0AAD8UFI5_GLOAC|nr:uncharacterized protein BDZ83DRAFT_635321 [Colletotrichum acutatum]KAK1716000.1 hypothetical protein BDZ83DRAFT_635321 [Colletotrichum acutatum]